MVPDAKTIWLFKELLTKQNLVEQLFAQFDGYLKEAGFIARGGQIIDASFVQVPKQRNKKDENDQIKAGQTPKEWKEEPAKLRQKKLRRLLDKEE